MDEMAVKQAKPKKMAEELKEHGENWAYIVKMGTVVLIGPGEAFKGTPMMAYNEDDLNAAVGQGLLQKKNWQVHDHRGKSSTFEVFVSP